jgi:hypothetical protein
LTAQITSKAALAKLKREFQLTPTMPTGGISVPPAVALGLCDELAKALDVIEVARRIAGADVRVAPGPIARVPTVFLNLLDGALARFDGTEKEESAGQ